MATPSIKPPAQAFHTGRQFKSRASYEVRDLDMPFERPLGLDRQLERLESYLDQRKADPTACRGDRFCNGTPVRNGLCAGHLQLAHRARALQQTKPSTQSLAPTKIGQVGIGNR